MKTERKVQCLTYLAVVVYDERLMLIEVKGNSDHEQPGIPKLVPTYELGQKSEGGILELDFINQPVEFAERENVLFELKTVIDLGKLPDDLKGIKVNASENADIALFNL
ncbi:MAG: hypothetical protein C0591_13490 [Marinilabiliales bacterium]|nr:MAG: hypothetical protein C0591_13490 [Marinilabiliales bacterium]